MTPDFVQALETETKQIFDIRNECQVALSAVLGCTDTDMGTGTGTIWWHEQFLKNYNMIWQIGHHYDMGTTRIWHGYSTPNEASVHPRCSLSPH